MCNINR
jgi:hypothetical protein